MTPTQLDELDSYRQECIALRLEVDELRSAMAEASVRITQHRDSLMESEWMRKQHKRRIAFLNGVLAVLNPPAEPTLKLVPGPGVDSDGQ